MVPAVVAVSGVVADGPLKDATVCYDLNDNKACDTGEPNDLTGADGKYSFDIAAAASGRHSVLASLPATAVDKPCLPTPAPPSAVPPLRLQWPRP